VDDADESRRLEPGLAVHLDGHALIAQNGDLDRVALGDPVMLKIDDPRGGHLNRSENGHHLQDSIVEAGSDETVVLLVTSPKIGSAHKTKKKEKREKE
jgi:hypothetical protein